MMIFYNFALLISAAEVFAATSSCTYDNASPSPTDIDTAFCSSYIADHCSAVPTLDPADCENQCGCLLASETETATPASNNTPTTETNTSSDETQAPATPIGTVSSVSSLLTSARTNSVQTPTTETVSADPITQLSSSLLSAGNSTTSVPSTASDVRVTQTSGTTGGLTNSTHSTSLASQPFSSLSSSPSAQDSNAATSTSATATLTTLSTPSDAGVSGTQSPLTVPGNITVAISSSTSFRSYNTSYQSPYRPSSTGAGWNATSYRTQSSNPTISGVNATSVKTPTETTGLPSSTPGTISWANVTITTGTTSTPAAHNETQTPSRTPPVKPSNGTFTPVTESITGSATTVGISEPPTFTTPLSPLSSSSAVSWNSTAHSTNVTATVTTFAAANFTSITRTAAATRETCYQLAQDPQGDAPRRALMRNAKLREQNLTIPSPYIESVDFESDGIDPLWLTVRDSTESTHCLDISNKSQIAIVGRDGTSMKLDAKGIYFSTDDCRYDVSITTNNFLGQLAKLSGVECSTGSRMRKRLLDLPFTQTLVLRDQCDKPVDRLIRSYPRLSIGTSECTDVSVNESTGTWKFDCMFPGSESSTMQCQVAIKNDVVDFLTTAPFGGSCPDLSTVVTTLGTTGRDFLDEDSLRTELYNQDLSDEERIEASRALESYQHMWLVLQEVFTKNKSGESALETYLNLYNQYRDFPTDVCEDINASEIPLDLSLRAGASRFVINTLNFAPEETIPQVVTVQDPAKVACCSEGSVASDKDGNSGTCGYPASAFIQNSGCVCGKTADGDSVAFEYTECENFVGDCETDQDCLDDGHSGFICMTGTCCGGGVCVDPYACSENGTQLVTFEPWRI